MKLAKYLKLDQILKASNLVEYLDKEDVKAIGRDVHEHYDADLKSRADWDNKYKMGMELALQVMQRKSEPWDGASNVKFPLITIAALNFNAMAYPTLIDQNDLVNCVVWTDDPKGEMKERATRIANHMTWQNIEQDEDWEEEQDKLLIALPIMGTVFARNYFDGEKRRKETTTVLPQDLIVNYWTKGDINYGPRASYRHTLSANQIRSRVVRGVFDALEEGVQTRPFEDNDDVARQVMDRRQGMIQPPTDDSNTPIQFIEQMCWYDVDGDGYAEPYLATVEVISQRLRRLVARFFDDDVTYRNLGGKKTVHHIEPQRIYEKVELIPAPDGGYYGLGFAQLLGPINESVNTALNQLFDAGTMSVSGGGFLGRGAKFRGGDKLFKPWEWKTVDSTGDDLRKNLVQLPTKEPSLVLFQLLEFLVQYSERITSATETQVGAGSGENVKAKTAEILNENGRRIYTACYKRVWRAYRGMYRIQFDLNKRYLKADRDFTLLTNGPTKMLQAGDYMPPITRISIRPAADPNVVSRQQAVDDAEFLLGLSLKLPGFNRYQTTLRALKARKVTNIDQVYPPPVDAKGQPAQDYPSPPDPKMILAQVEQQRAQMEGQELQHKMQVEMIEVQAEMQLNGAKIEELKAKATLELAQAGATNQGHAVGAMQVQLQAAELKQKELSDRRAQLSASHTALANLLDSMHQRHHDAAQNAMSRAHERGMQQREQEHERAMNNDAAKSD